MTMQDMLNTIEANVGLGARATEDLFQYHQMLEDRAQSTIETDIANIQACLNGLCSLSWKPNKQ